MMLNGIDKTLESLETEQLNDEKEIEDFDFNIFQLYLIEAAIKSRFQVWFQGLCFFPALVFFMRDSYVWSYDIRILSIVASSIIHAFFMSFVFKVMNKTHRI